jgi:hypothetical protein
MKFINAKNFKKKNTPYSTWFFVDPVFEMAYGLSLVAYNTDDKISDLSLKENLEFNPNIDQAIELLKSPMIKKEIEHIVEGHSIDFHSLTGEGHSVYSESATAYFDDIIMQLGELPEQEEEQEDE